MVCSGRLLPWSYWVINNPYFGSPTTIWNIVHMNQAISWNDALIATITLDQNCRVYAVDKHFDEMAKTLDLPLYKPGYNGMFSRE